MGSVADAEDAVQETLLRAWKHLGSFEPRSPLSAWMFRIATNVCLTDLTKPAATSTIEPISDALLDLNTTIDPALSVERNENIGLAFVAALRTLPARQRAIVLLRDVLVWPRACGASGKSSINSSTLGIATTSQHSLTY